MKYWLLLPLSTKLPHLLISVVLLSSFACGVASLPVKSDVLPTAENSLTPSKKQGQISTGHPKPTNTPSCTVSAEKLNLRASPGTDAEADSDGLKRGDKLERIGAVAGWWKVIVEDGREGWVKREFVECE